MKSMGSEGLKDFLTDDFLLENKTAAILYHEYAAKQAIIDYHNHLSPEDIANDRSFKNLTEIWLEGDHYKWRAMRTLGISEEFITGKSNDYEKFQKWAETVPYTIRNPLFHWTHLELKRYFDIDEALNPKTAGQIYSQSSELLETKEFSTRSLLAKMNVEVVCTTDDPVDDLRHHQSLKEEGVALKMLPAFRPDKAILIQSDGYVSYLEKLGEVARVNIHDFQTLWEALEKRLEYFHEHGCRLSDHGLERVYAASFTDAEVDIILKKRLSGKELNEMEAEKFMSALLYHLGCAYADRGWVQQLHLGALRNNNTRLKNTLGADAGFDSIGDWSQAKELSKFLNRLDGTNRLAKTILYNLNPKDNEVLASMIGNFNDGSVKGKMQYGSAWWFLDQKNGMEKQLNALSNMGLLSCFIGMLTDSRSFLSFPRHEYFRRILCNLIGRDVHNGELPNDIEWLGGIVNDICYNNAKVYFGF